MIAVHLLHASILLGVTAYGMNALSAARAYVEGEGLYSKAEKESVLQLVLYADTGDEAHYRAYEQEINVSLGDAHARVELEKPTFDMGIVRIGFVQGRNHPDDVENMAWLFRTFRHEAHIEKAIGIWEQADQNVTMLMAKADTLHEARASETPDPAGIALAVRDIMHLDSELTVLERDFSVTLGDAARWMTGVVVAGTIGLTVVFVGSAAIISFLVTRQLTRSLKELESGATRIASGDLGSQVADIGKDEVGRVAHAFNLMSQRLADAVNDGEQRTAALLASERAARKAHEEIQQIYERIPEAFFALDRDFRLLYMNPMGRKMSRASGQTAYGQILWEANPDLIDSDFHREYSRALRENVVVTVEQYYPRMDRWFEATAYPSNEGLSVFFRDVTERKHANQAARESEERYRLVVENVKDYAIFMLDPKGRVLSWNTGAERLKGYQANEVIGNHFRMFYSPEDQARGHPEYELQRALKDGRYEEEGWRIRKDGSRFWANVALTPVYSGDATLRGFAKVTRDLTDQKRVDEQLRATATKYRLLADHSTDVITSKRPDGSFEYVSPSAKVVLGYEPEEVMAMNFDERIQPEDLDAIRRARRRVLAEGQLSRPVFRFRRKDGTVIWIEAAESPGFDAEGRVTRIVGAMRDITVRKETEDRVVASLKEKEVLLKEIHHRVKNNLQVTSGLLLLQSKQAKDEPTRSLFVESMGRVKSMALVHEKLYTSKNLASIDFSDYVDDLLRDLTMSYGAAERQVAVKSDLQQLELDVDTSVNLGLILNELVSNALKYAFPAGRQGLITVSLRAEEDGKMSLRVRDDGVGLPPDFDIEHLTTMGLQLVTGLSQQVNGEMVIHRGEGTDVCVTFTPPRVNHAPKER